MADQADPVASLNAGPPVGPFPGPQMARLRQVLARSPFWVDDNANLRVIATTDQPNQTVTISWRKATPGGEIQVNRAILDLGPVAGTKTIDTGLSEGLLYNITVQLGTLPALQIATFVQVLIVNGTGSTATVLGTLIGAYITNGQSVGWPGTPIHLSTEGPGFLGQFRLGTPGFGVDWTVTVPAGTRWSLTALSALLTTSGAAGARQSFFQISSAGFPIWQGTTPGAVGAANQARFTLAPGVIDQIGFPVLLSLPQPCLLGPGDKILVITTGLLAGDQWTNIAANFVEWLEIP